MLADEQALACNPVDNLLLLFHWKKRKEKGTTLL
jgi:hypothetical protein